MRIQSGNRIRLLCSGEQYFPALEVAIDSAVSEIFLETYIFAPDESGWRIARALMRAARRGVIVHLLIDGFGSLPFPSDLRSQMLEAGVQFMVYRPEVSLVQFRRRRLRRLHRKLAIVDGRIGFCGGINIIHDLETTGQKPPRYDYAVSIEGPLLADMHLAMRQLWLRVTRRQLKRPWRPLSHPALVLEPAGTQHAAFLVRDNFRHRRDIESVYLQAIARAQREVVIANAYFLPGMRFRRALCDTARRGVRVVLLLQGHVEYVLVHYASRALYRQLLDAGVEIHEYAHSFLHAKVAVIDEHWATVGSSNIDPFSLLLAREANVVVEDEGFARELRASLHQAIEGGAKPVHPERGGHMGVFMRMTTWTCYVFVRLLTGISGSASGDDLP